MQICALEDLCDCRSVWLQICAIADLCDCRSVRLQICAIADLENVASVFVIYIPLSDLHVVHFLLYRSASCLRIWFRYLQNPSKLGSLQFKTLRTVVLCMTGVEHDPVPCYHDMDGQGSWMTQALSRKSSQYMPYTSVWIRPTCTAHRHNHARRHCLLVLIMANDLGSRLPQGVEN